MIKRLFVFQITLSIFCHFLNANQPFSATTQPENRAHFKSAEKQIECRWIAFEKNRIFKIFAVGKSNVVLEEEFRMIKKTREQLWTTSGYERAENLILGDLVRAPGCEAFDFNNTVPNFNASTMYFGDKHYIACEGPRQKDVSNFFELIATQRVTHLVRLTNSCEGEKVKCHPYWEGRLTKLSHGVSRLNIPTKTDVYPIRAFDMAYWKDNQAVDPNKLLALTLQVREELKDPNSLLTVHCSAGVGRTGTFFAALMIVDAIDRGVPFSIEEIVYRLSLQRAHSVGKFGQYTTLHRLAENYLNQKS